MQFKGAIMSILKKATFALPTKEPQFTKRLFNGGFERMGCIKRESDTRTTKQLLENIDYFAKKYPEVAKFKNELKAMNQKYLGLVSDICELANHYEMTNTAIDIKKPASNGKSLFQFLMEKLPATSKENPALLDLFKEIINNSDSIAAKYSLGELVPLYKCKEASQHIEAAIPLVNDIAETTLQGGYLMNYLKEQRFVDGIKSLISPNVIVEKLKMLPKILQLAEKSKAACQVHVFPFVTNNTPASKINNNIETFKKLDVNMDGKTINLTDFLEKNTDLKG